MQFVLHNSLFCESDNSVQIVSLLSIAARSLRHVALPQIHNSPQFDAWKESLDVQMRKQVEQLLDSFYRSVARKVFKKQPLVVGGGGGDQQPRNGISIDEALSLAQRPFRIYLENSRNDRAFLVAFASAEQAARLDELERQNGVMVINGGGITELKAQIERDIEDGRALADYAWVMFDSDSLTPKAPSDQSKALADCCDRLGVMQTQLNRRAIENYIPKDALRNWVYQGKKKNNEPRTERITTFLAYLELPCALAHHYNMKNGIVKDRRRQDYPGDAIYSVLTAEIVERLASGFGSDVAEVYSMSWVTESDLRKDGSWPEINGAIARLENHL